MRTLEDYNILEEARQVVMSNNKSRWWLWPLVTLAVGFVFIVALIWTIGKVLGLFKVNLDIKKIRNMYIPSIRRS